MVVQWSTPIVLAFWGLVAGVTLPDDDRDGCKKLKADYALDCAACLQELPPEESCTARTAADDAATETVALFSPKGGTKIWNNTKFLFATDEVQDVELKMSVSNFNFLRANPAKEQYTSGSVKIAGQPEVSGVGLRLKGFFGSLRICLIGWMRCEKLSWKIKFNYMNKSQTFFGLKKLQLHASIHDQTLMRERLAYSLWREVGVMAPRQVHARVKLTLDDGTSHNLGIHLLTEVIDGRFTETYKSGDGGDGNLYKEAWPGVGPGVGLESYKHALRTNEDKNPDVSRLVEFGKVLAAASSDYDLALAVKKYTRAREMARYWAVDRAIEHWDGPVNFRLGAGANCEEYGYPEPNRWNSDADCCANIQTGARCKNGLKMTVLTSSCAEGAWGKANYYTCGEQPHWNHNYFLYQEDTLNVSKQEFRMVAWDVDGVFGEEQELKGSLGARPDWDTPVCEKGGSSCTTCNPFTSTGGLSRQVAPSCFSIIRAFTRGLRSDYMQAVSDLLKGGMQTCRLLSKIDRWRKALAPYIQQDIADGTWPAKSECKAAKATDWEGIVQNFRDRIIPYHVRRLRNSVSCSRSYDANAWDPVSYKAIMPMLRIDEMQTGAWRPGWLEGSGPMCSANSRTTSGISFALFLLALCSRI